MFQHWWLLEGFASLPEIQILEIQIQFKLIVKHHYFFFLSILQETTLKLCSDTGCDYLIKLCKYSNYCNLASVNGFKVRGQVIVFTNFAEIHFLLLPLTPNFKPLLPGSSRSALLCLPSWRGNIVQLLHRDRQIS